MHIRSNRPAPVSVPGMPAGRRHNPAGVRPTAQPEGLRASGQTLPAQLTPLLGRERDAETVRTRLLRADVRLLTLTGPAGTGKTRLAVHVAAELIDDLEHGAVFVALDAIRDPHLVASAIARTLGVREAGGRSLREGLQDYLQDKQLLLVLDNFEQVLPAARLVAELLAACPGLKVLVTSRAALRLRGEHEVTVAPLALPDPAQLQDAAAVAQSPAVALFAQRVQALQPDFRLTAANARTVAEICIRLEGLPLALELAAVRTRILSPQAILARLAHRLQLLTSGTRDLPVRQQTLRAALGWSYDLLDAEEQRLFRRLAVFAGGCTLEAAQAVCTPADDRTTDALDILASLVDKSLVQSVLQPDGEPRFRMLETIREYALEQLAASGELETTQRHHAAFFMTLAEEAEPQLTSAARGAWLDRLEAEHDNLRAALAWSRLQPGGDTGLRLAGACWWFWHLRGHVSEGRRWLESLLELPGSQEHTAARAKALYGAGGLAWVQGDYGSARSLVEESVALWQRLGDTRGLAYSLTIMGLVVDDQGDHARARALYKASVELFRAVEDSWGRAWSLFCLGRAALVAGDGAMTRSRYEESLAIFRQVGDTWAIALVLNNLAGVALVQGHDDAAGALFEEGLALLREAGDKWAVAMALSGLGRVAFRQGDHRRATARYAESLALRWDVAGKRGIAGCLIGLAEVAGALGEHERAARLVGAAASLLDAIGTPVWPVDRAQFDHAVAAARAGLGEDAFAAAWAAGRALPLDQAVGYALAAPPPPPYESVAAAGAPAPRLPTLLTPREREVATLLAQGLTNRQIAGELVISERTADAHVANILSKLGFRSRAQIATWAVEQGLVAASPG